ncbi:hypothetical protein ABW19_dt0207002 [Dactylella cylindrospora]|nr:hypothetical protein ABW19_dt0207002 [Dactylella cylindrospora]
MTPRIYQSHLAFGGTSKGNGVSKLSGNSPAFRPSSVNLEESKSMDDIRRVASATELGGSDIEEVSESVNSSPEKARKRPVSSAYIDEEGIILPGSGVKNTNLSPDRGSGTGNYRTPMGSPNVNFNLGTGVKSEEFYTPKNTFREIGNGDDDDDEIFEEEKEEEVIETGGDGDEEEVYEEYEDVDEPNKLQKRSPMQSGYGEEYDEEYPIVRFLDVPQNLPNDFQGWQRETENEVDSKIPSNSNTGAIEILGFNKPDDQGIFEVDFEDVAESQGPKELGDDGQENEAEPEIDTENQLKRLYAAEYNQPFKLNRYLDVSKDLPNDFGGWQQTGVLPTDKDSGQRSIEMLDPHRPIPFEVARTKQKTDKKNTEPGKAKNLIKKLKFWGKKGNPADQNQNSDFDNTEF